ncbi:MAG TPA: thioester domain-containing protein [Actinophytocola sp.]|nr:thioester domain-containing protein [Actinophytocola sp.]
MASMLRIARALSVLTGSAAILVFAGGTASADATSGVVDHAADVGGYSVDVGDGVFGDLATSLIGFRLADGTVLGVYCVEIDTEIDDTQEMVEQPWEEFPAAGTPFAQNQDRINWVLHNGFPVREPDALTEALDGVALNGGIDEREAITATQAAVWHFSDGRDLDRENPLPDEGPAADADVLALYDFLTGENNVGIGEQPPAALAIEPDDLTGAPGDRIGPFTVDTSGKVAGVAANLPDGVQLTDADGNPLDASQVKDGTELFVTVPGDAAAGEASVEVTATAVVDTGRLFVGENYAEAPTQSLIVAKAVESQVAATAKASWNGEVAPAAQAKADSSDDGALSDLAETGASILGPVLLGAVLVGAGIVSVLFVRNRRQV